jgi:trans-aconitate 2-methyltransferase
MDSQIREIFPGEVFANTADFDRGIRQLLPKYDEMLEAIACGIPTTAKKIIDLGCGTGELSLKILQRCPEAMVMGMDYSARMIDFADIKTKAAGYSDRWSGIEMDFGDWASDQESGYIGIQFDACVSSLAIHHLSDEMKLNLFKCVAKVLKPGGVFWNADPVLPENEQIAQVYQAIRENWSQQQGTTLEQVRSKIGTSRDRGYSSQDRLARLETQLQMLKEAGFNSVTVLWKYYGIAVFGGFV